LRKKTFLFFAKGKKLKLKKIRSIQGGKEMNKILKRYKVKHLEKRFIKKVKRLFKVISPILTISKAIKKK
jgi:hypothetical protein